jgi:hypothetical protein
VPTEADVVVKRLRAAGAIIIGMTNVPELGSSGAGYNMIFPPLLTPTIACTPFKQGIQGPELIEGKKAGPFQWIALTYQFNMTGQPAVTVPAGFTKDGLPIGLRPAARRRHCVTGGGRLRGCCAMERQVAAYTRADGVIVELHQAAARESPRHGKLTAITRSGRAPSSRLALTSLSAAIRGIRRSIALPRVSEPI